MDSISVFVFHVRKVFVPVVTGKITGAFFSGTPCIYESGASICIFYERHVVVFLYIFIYTGCPKKNVPVIFPVTTGTNT